MHEDGDETPESQSPRWLNVIIFRRQILVQCGDHPGVSHFECAHVVLEK